MKACWIYQVLQPYQFYETQLSKDLQLIKKTYNHPKNQKKGHISLSDQKNSIIYKFFKDFTNHRKKI